jgi:hypothetical protein
MRSILFETETNEIRSEVQTFCNLVKEETYEKHLVVLPEDVLSAYKNEIQVGTLFLSIQNPAIIDNKVVVQPDSKVTILDQVKNVGRGRRHLNVFRDVAPRNQTTGNRLLKVYRVLTSANTANDPPAQANMETAVFGDGVSVKTQYAACSNGLLTLTNARVETVRIDRSIDAFTRYDALADYTTQFLIKRGDFVSITDIADNVIFAVPALTRPAPDQASFIGQGDVTGRESIFSGKWAEDHSTLMHEIGHNFGLVHAGKDKGNCLHVLLFLRSFFTSLTYLLVHHVLCRYHKRQGCPSHLR